MQKKTIQQKSISQIHEYMGFEKPTHPLITIIDLSKLEYGEDIIGLKISSD